MLLTLLGFHLFMLNQYHFSLGYFNWFILFADVNILVFCYFIVFWFLKSSFFLSCDDMLSMLLVQVYCILRAVPSPIQT